MILTGERDSTMPCAGLCGPLSLVVHDEWWKYEMRVGIELDDSTYVLGVWFVGFQAGDWLCVVWQEGAGWMARYRFRYYSDAKSVADPFSFQSESLDKKSWYDLEISNSSEDAVIEDMRELARTDLPRLAAAKMGWEPPHCMDEIVVRGNGSRAVEELRRRPWAHVMPIQ